MINFDALTLKLFCDENFDFFSGARVQKIQQPNRYELILFIRNNSETRKLYINFNPNFYHICFMSKENEEKRCLNIPKTAPMFCMLLRKYILNAKIVNIAVPKYERIFEIYFDYFDELNEKSQLCLSIELMGKHSNVILYNYDTNIIIGCAHNVSSEKSRERELSGLMPYIYPPKKRRKNLLKVSLDDFISAIDNSNIIHSISLKYYYLTVPVVENIFNSIKPVSYDKLYNSLLDYVSCKHLSFCISKDFSKYFLFNFENSFICKTINELIDNYFAFHQNLLLIDNLKSKLISYIDSQLKKLHTLRIKQEEQIKKLDKAFEYKLKADIIMANIYNIKKIKELITLYDFEGNEILINMDINISPIDNANKYYSMYKKVKSSFEHAKLMIEDTKASILYFDEQKFYIENEDNLSELREIYSEMLENKNIFPAKEKKFKIDTIEYNGFLIFIGKNKNQNDYILSKIASAEDLWFHPLNAAGAHILVKNNDKKNVPNDVLLKAAQITKEYSSQRDNSKTSIIYTKRKYVKKANNKIAFVTYKNETEIVI